MKVIKRSGRAQAFNQEKITKAISQANASLAPDDRVSNEIIEEVSNQVTERLHGFD